MREFSRVDLVALARQAIETVQPYTAEQHIMVTLHNTTPVILTADRGEIEIILNNLITNAVKYNRDNGAVDITITDSDDTVVITVADTGIGMTQKEASRLFNDFVRIKNEKTRHILGSGLGLSTVKKIASLYNGDVSVSSAPDAGSKFTVELKQLLDAETSSA